MLLHCAEGIYFLMMHKLKPYQWLFCWVVSLCSLQLYGYIDTRPLVDLGRYYQSMPDWLVFFDTWNLQRVGPLLTQFAGWLNFILSLCVYIGHSPEAVFAGYAISTSGLFWWSLRKNRTLSFIFLLMQPIWQVGWRTHWIHALETSLLLLVWQGSRDNQSRFWLGLISMFVVWLRPSAIIWLILLLGWNLKYGETDKRSLSGIVIGMVLGVAMIWPNLIVYVSGKMSVPRVEMDWMDQISRHGGLLPTVLMIVIWFWYSVQKLRDEDWMYILWIVCGSALAMVFGVGVDNFPLLFVGVALLCGGCVVQRWVHWSVVSLCVVLNALPFIDGIPRGLSPLLHSNLIQETPFDFQRPIHRTNAIPKVEDVRGLLGGLCAQVRPHCIVVTTGNLFHPHRESLGRLAILSPSLKHIRIEKAELWYRRPQQIGAVDVAVVQQCLEQEEVWPVHFRRSALEFTQQIHTWSQQGVLNSESCSWIFFVPSPFQENR